MQHFHTVTAKGGTALRFVCFYQVMQVLPLCGFWFHVKRLCCSQSLRVAQFWVSEVCQQEIHSVLF